MSIRASIFTLAGAVILSSTSSAIADELAPNVTQLASQLGAVETDYSTRLASLESRFKSQLRQNGDNTTQVAIIDPSKYDVATALGANAETAIQAVLMSKGVSSAVAKALAGSMKYKIIKPAVINGKEVGFTFIPGIDFAQKGQTRFCIITPPDLATVPEPILRAGMNKEDAFDYAVGHEFSHCPRLSLTQNDTQSRANLEGASSQSAQNSEIIAENQDETWADVVYAGERFATGKSAIASIVAYRSKGTSIEHFTVPGLLALNSQIEQNPAAFAALPYSSRYALYTKIVQDYALNEQRLSTVIQFNQSGNAERKKLAITTDPEVLKALSYTQLPMQPPSSAPIAIKSYEVNFNTSSLANDIFAVASAYGRQRDEFAKETDARDKIILLRSRFISTVRRATMANTMPSRNQLALSIRNAETLRQ